MYLDPKSLVVPSRKVLANVQTKDGFNLTFDKATIDSTGVFLVGELERLDQTLHMPLVEVSWQRDIDLREDVSMADEVSSFTNSSFAAAGGLTPGGIAWIAKDANAITGIGLDIGKTAAPLDIWGMELKFTIPELISAQKAGRPVDAQKYEGMKLKDQMDTDQLVYIGDPLLVTYGLVNQPVGVVSNVANVANGAAGSPLFSNKTPEEILADFNELLTSVWAASGWAQMPNRIILPPARYGYLVSQKVSIGDGQASIMRYILENNITIQQMGESQLKIYPAKWCIGTGSGGTQGLDSTPGRMVAYTKDPQRVRYPMTPMQKTPLEYRSIYQITTYFSRKGRLEVVYPETVGYRDGM
jgi:hypothetical protein